MKTEEEKREKLLNIRPLVLVFIGIVCGIVCAYYSFLFSSLIALICFLCFAIFFFCLGFIKRENKKGILVLSVMVLISFAIGFANSTVRINLSKKSDFNNQYGTYVGRVYERASYDSGALIYLDNVTFCDSNLKGKSVAFVYSDDLVGKLDVGSVISCDAFLVNETLNQNGDYENFSGVYFSLEEVKNVKIIDFEANLFEFGYIKARAFLKQNLSSKSAPVALAMLLGDTSEFQKNKLDNYRYAGVAHIFAVSGLHVGVMVACFTFLCNKFKVKPKLKPLIILLPTFIYCGFCGFRPSSVRAFVMAFCAIMADAIGFKKDNLSVLAVAGIILLLINPFNLYDYGFKLSFLAVCSIFALSPLFKRKTARLKCLSEPLSTTLSAQLGTLPVLTQMSGYTSIISLFSNLLFIPVSVVIYVFTMACFVLSAFFSLFIKGATIIMQAPNFLIGIIDGLISAIDFSIFSFNVEIKTFSIIWYVGLVFISDYFNFSKLSKTLVFVLTVLLTFGLTLLLA